MAIPTEAERSAGYHASMAATIAAGGKNVKGSGSTQAPGHVAPGSGVIQTDDTARHIHEISERKARSAEKVLTPIGNHHCRQRGPSRCAYSSDCRRSHCHRCRDPCRCRRCYQRRSQCEAGGQMSGEIVPVNYGRAVVPDGQSRVATYQATQAAARAAETGESKPTGDPAFPLKLQLAKYVEQHSDRDGNIASEIFAVDKVLTSGYEVPPGIRIHAAVTYDYLTVAKEIGLPQQYVTAFSKCYASAND